MNKEEWLDTVPDVIRYAWAFNTAGALCGIVALVLVLVLMS